VLTEANLACLQVVNCEEVPSESVAEHPLILMTLSEAQCTLLNSTRTIVEHVVGREQFNLRLAHTEFNSGEVIV